MSETNTFNKFKNLINNSTTDVVTITVNNGDGTSQATTLSGQTVIVKGEQVTPSNKAFIRDNEIIRQAPNLTVTEVSV